MNTILLNIIIILKNLFSFPQNLLSYLLDYFKFLFIIPKNKRFKIYLFKSYPCLTDKTTLTPVEPIYFLQNTWCARKVFSTHPVSHIDVGSATMLVGIIAQHIPTTMVDIRPLPLDVNGLTFLKGDILNLPFKTASVKSISSICVIEHIGLGRYGDKLDAFGTEKAATELTRVVAKHGDLYITVPVHDTNYVQFNAHRTFTREKVLHLFESFNIIEEQYLYGMKIQKKYDAKKGFGTGMFHFRKK